MNKKNDEIIIGEIVEVLRGRDKGKYMIVTKVLDDRYILLADGDKRKYDSMKKKNRLHIKKTNIVAQEVVVDYEKNGRFSNAKMRYALQQLLRTQRESGQE